MAFSDRNNEITEGTNYMVDCLANSDKIGPKESRWYYTKNPNNNSLNNLNNDADIDADFNEFKNNNHDNQDNQDNLDNNTQNYQNNNSYNDNNTQNYQNYNDNHDNNTEKPETKPKSDKYIDEDYEALTPLEKRLRRLDLMRKLGELKEYGCHVTNYTIDDDYYMMKYELELHTSIRQKRNWLGLYNHMLIGAVKGVELANNNWNPFDFSLRGLSDHVSNDKSTYVEILAEIYEFHNVPGKKMNPWFRLFITLIGAVVVVGGKNNAHKLIPNRSEKVENDPEYIERMRAIAVMDKKILSDSSAMNNSNNINNPNREVDEYMNKQHEATVQKIRDLEELKRQELQYQKYQKMMSENKGDFNNMKNNLELSQSYQDTDRKSVRSSRSSRHSKESQKSRPKSLREEQIDQQINQLQNLQQLQQQINNRNLRPSRTNVDEDTISRMTSSSDRSDRSDRSERSQISINKNLADRLKKRNKIGMDAISFGSNKKGKAGNIRVGK